MGQACHRAYNDSVNYPNKNKKLKILYYNWVQFDNKKNIGGGVNIYQKNLIEALDKDFYDIYFLSSGWKYNPFKNKIYIRQTHNIFEDKCKSFEIINSSIIAPAFNVYMNPNLFITDTKSLKIFDEFLQKNGPFDVIHFNNIEGISINVLGLKEKYPNTKFIMSVHNYQIICPLVQCFQNHNNCICKNNNNGHECIKCTFSKPNRKSYVKNIRNYFKTIAPVYLKFLFNIISKLFIFQAESYMGSAKTMKAELYNQYIRHNIETVNKYADAVLCVSERVSQIMIEKGINPKLVKTSYIGTKIAEIEQSKATKEKINFPKIPFINFTICYLGYKRYDKGYYFMINALSKLPDEIAGKINLILGVKNINLKELKEKIHVGNILIYDGYKHDELKTILANVDLGIVPVLWEDNLPQVAIEMVAHGVPILCSSFGGASELCKENLFKFDGGDTNNFITKLTEFINNPKLLQKYWENHTPLMTMEKHIKELEQYYKSK